MNETPIPPPAPPSRCACGDLRIQHPRGGKSIVAGSACQQYEAAK